MAFADVHHFGYGDVLREHRRSRPSALAVVDGAVRLTYEELDIRVNRLRTALMATGCGAESTLLWIGQNSHRLLELILAAAKLGARVCPANWRLSPAELARVIDEIDPSLVVWQAEELSGAVAAARALSTRASAAAWLCHDDSGEYEAFLRSGGDEDDDGRPDASRPLLILYTSAFGGRPLPALLSQQSLLLQGLQLGYVQSFSEAARTLVVGPMFHIATFLTVNATYCWGGAVVMAARATSGTVAALIDAEGCTHGFIPGPTLQQLRDEVAQKKWDLTSMFPTPDAIDPAMTLMSPPDSLWRRVPGTSYGQTETTGILLYSQLAVPARARSGSRFR